MKILSINFFAAPLSLFILRNLRGNIMAYFYGLYKIPLKSVGIKNTVHFLSLSLSCLLGRYIVPVSYLRAKANGVYPLPRCVMHIFPPTCCLAHCTCQVSLPTASIILAYRDAFLRICTKFVLTR